MAYDIIKIRRDSYASWESVNPTLSLGEISYDLTNKEIRVGDGSSAWLDLTPIGSGTVADGDKGDIVVTDSGATWSLDPTLVTLINQKIDQGPLDGGSADTAGQVMQVRRDTTVGWAATSTILDNGEIGYDTTTNEIRIGDGVNFWADLVPVGVLKMSTVVMQQLGDVDYPVEAPQDGQVLTWDAGLEQWVNLDIPAQTFALEDITNVTLTAPANTEILQFNGTAWVNAPAPTGGGGSGVTAGTKNEITVIDPDSNWTITTGTIEPIAGGVVENYFLDRRNQPQGIAGLDINGKLPNELFATNDPQAGYVLLGNQTWGMPVITQAELDLAEPTVMTDAATKNYVDGAVGLGYELIHDMLDGPNGIATLNADRLLPLDTLDDGGATTGQALIFDGTEWAPGTVSTTLAGLDDITLTSVAINDILIKGASDWINTPASSLANFHSHSITQTTLAAGQQVSGRLIWWNNDTGLLRTVTLNGAGLASASHDNTANTFTITVPESHTHAQSDITNLVSDLAGKAASSHTHAQSDITNLVSDLAGKAASSHTHSYTDINQGSATTNQVLTWNGSAWGPATATGATDILEHLYMDGTSYGNFTWRTSNIGAGSQNHPEYFDYTNGYLLTTTSGADNDRWWLHQGALADYDSLDNDLIVKWNGQINTWDPTDMYCIVGAFITHAQASWDPIDVGGSLQRMVGFITSPTGNTWRCAVWHEPDVYALPDIYYEETFGFDTDFLITDEHTLQVVICDQGTKAVFYVDGAIVAETENTLYGSNDATTTAYTGLHVRHLATSTTASVVRTNSLEVIRLLQDSCVTPGVMLASKETATTTSAALSELSDVVLTSIVGNDILTWNVATSKWVNISRTGWLSGYTLSYNSIQPPPAQQATSRLVWWNADSGVTRTLIPSATGQATLTLDEAANTMVIDVPAQDATLTALAGVTTSADTVIYATGSDTFTTTPLTSTARTLLDDTSTSAMRTTLGLGTMATQDASAVAITGGTISDATVTTGTYSSSLNQAVMKLVRNNTGSTIAKGKVVRITGSLGDNLTVALADATDESTSASTIGITAESIADSADGFIITQGVLTNLTGIDTPLVNGDLLWLSETAGEFTRTRPTAPAHGVVIGWVMSTSSGSAGRIYVKIDNGYELNELHNVSIPSTPADKDLLAWDNATGVWKNMTKTTAGFGTLATLNTVGTSEITALSVTNAKLANSSITPVKLSNQSTTNSLVGFDDTGVGDYYTAGSGIVIDGSTMTISATASGGAPVGATYIVQTSDGTLTNEQSLGSLATGILKNTTTAGTGVLSIATGSDLPSHTHAQSDITNLVTDLAGKASTSHTHAQSDITNLVTDLAGKASTSHTHSASDITSGSLALARIAQGGATSGQVLKWNNISAVWEPGTDNTGGSASPGGSDRQVQFNDSNLVIAGASQVAIEAGGNLKLIKPGSAPSTPSSNELVLYPITYANREQLAFKDESGFVSNLQVCLAKNKVRIYNASNTNAVAGVFGFPAFTTVGTITARNFATTNLLSTITRHAYVATTSAAQSWAQMRSPNSGLFCWRGNSGSLGGFYVLFRFAISDATLNTGGEAFVGLSTTLTAMANTTSFNVESLADSVGLYAIDGATVWSIGSNDNTGTATMTSLGASFPVDNTSFMELILFAKPNDTAIYYEVTNISTGANTSGTLTTDLPRNTVGLGVQIIRGNNTSTSSAPAFDVSQIYAETQY